MGLASLVGCKQPEPDSALDDAIAAYLQQRQQRTLAACECYPLFVDLTVPGGAPYASEEACLAANTQPQLDDAIRCIAAVLDATPLDDEDKVSAMQCQAASVEASSECHAQNTATCDEATALQCQASGLSPSDSCNDLLTSDQLEAITHCTIQ